MWPYIWSDTHGPVPSLEPSAWETSISVWRKETIAKKLMRPIWAEIKANQRVFNGYGSQEACDMLFLALIHPCMPCHLVCGDEIYPRFFDAALTFHVDGTALMNSGKFPILSSESPFWFHLDSHQQFIRMCVLCYLRSEVFIEIAMYDKLKAMGLLDPNAVLQNSGKGKGKPFIHYIHQFLIIFIVDRKNPAPPSRIKPQPKPLPVPRGAKVHLPNYADSDI